MDHFGICKSPHIPTSTFVLANLFWQSRVHCSCHQWGNCDVILVASFHAMHLVLDVVKQASWSHCSLPHSSCVLDVAASAAEVGPVIPVFSLFITRVHSGCLIFHEKEDSLELCLDMRVLNEVIFWLLKGLAILFVACHREPLERETQGRNIREGELLKT